jgi:hypothetical protein
MNSKTRTVLVGTLVLALLTSALTFATITPTQQAAAQLGGLGGGATALSGNATMPTGNGSSMKALVLASAILKEKIKLALDKAILNATKEAGPDAVLLGAKLTIDGDNVVYKVASIKDGRIHVVKIDPDNGKILGVKDLALLDLLKAIGGQYTGQVDPDNLDTLRMLADHPLLRGFLAGAH